MFDLKSYQKEAVEAIGENLKKSLDSIRHAKTLSDRSKSRVCVLKSPTGSGKTLMMSAIIEKYLNNAITFVFSPGAGSLEVQTQHSLQKFLANTNIAVDELNNANISSAPLRGTVLVKNWDALTKTDENGVFTNRLSRDGETANIFDFVETATKLNIPLVIMVDESHYGKKSEATTVFKFLEYLHDTSLRAGGSRIPVVEFSATPVVTEYNFKHVVTFEDSIKAGLNRESIVINDGLENIALVEDGDSTSLIDTEYALLRGACEKLVELEGYYEEAGSAYRPLMGIQLPSSALGKSARERIEKFLSETYNWTIDNGTVAVFMHEAKTGDLENISTPESKVKVLLYKQAIATGWDCPRAQVFVGFRHIKSKTFTEQNLGRYCRTTEARHYTALDTPNYHALNQMYAYTNYSETAYMSESSMLSAGELKTSHVLHINDAFSMDVELVNGFNLPQSYVTYKHSKKLSSEVRKLMKTVADKNKNILDGAQPDFYDKEKLETKVLGFKGLDSGDFFEEVRGESLVSFGETRVQEDWDSFIQRTLRESLGGNISDFNTIASEVARNLSIRMRRATGLQDVDQAIRATLYNQHNRKLASNYLQEFAQEANPFIIDGELSNTYESVVRARGRFKLPAMITANSSEPYGNMLASKQIYVNHANSGGIISYRSSSPSMPETRFENMLLETFNSTNPYIEFRCMYKNGENIAEENFVNTMVIPVRDGDNRLRNFFPDYLLTFYNKETGAIIPMIVEVKGKKSHDNDQLLHAKTQVANNYMERTGMPFVVVREEEPGVFLVNERSGEKFEDFVYAHKEDNIQPVPLDDTCDWVIPSI